MTPFELWWKLYPGNRKKDKRMCRDKFNSFCEDEDELLLYQRMVYKDTLNRMKHWKDWEDEAFIHAPVVYLNQKMWEDPVRKQKFKEPRDTTNEFIPPLMTQQILQKLISRCKDKGIPTTALEKQLV